MATSFGTGGPGVNGDKNMAARGAGSKNAAKAKAKAKANQPSPTSDKNARATTTTTRAARGVAVPRLFTRSGTDPLENGAPGLDTVTGEKTELVYERRSSIITNPDGSIVFKMEGAEIPSTWSQLATDIVISKYFRKAGLFGDAKQGEKSVRQVVYRIAHTIRDAGDKFGGYFASKADADAFEHELSFLMVHQVGAFNSPVWFNCGLWAQYGITGSGGNWAWDSSQRAGNGPSVMVETKNAYERPQCSACFIQAANDDLMSIYELVKSEARLFKYGSEIGRAHV